LRLARTYGLAFYSRPATLAAMLADPATSALQRLELDSQGLSEHLLADLCDIPSGGLRELALTNTSMEMTLRPEDQRPRGILPSLLRAWRRPPEPLGPSACFTRLLRGLNRLSLRNVVVTGSLDISGLLGLSSLANLHTLEIDTGSIRGVSLTSPGLASLTALSLSKVALDNHALSALLGGSPQKRLTSLDLSGNRLDADAVPLITDSPALSGLRWLVLGGNPLGAGLRHLIDSEVVERLAWLDLRNTGLTEADALRLADRAPRLSALAWIDLRKNRLSDPVKGRLRKAFWPAAHVQA
jgi:hypothetical protein